MPNRNWTPEMVDRFNRLTTAEVGECMEFLPTDYLEWAVRFEALARVEDEDAQS